MHNLPPSSSCEEDPLLYERTATPLCRICYETDGVLLRSCECKGTQGLVHRECLKKWTTKYSTSPLKCEICNSEWTIEIHTPWEKFMKKFAPCFTILIFYIQIMSTIFLFDYCSRNPHNMNGFWYWAIYNVISNLMIYAVDRDIKTFTTFHIVFSALWVACTLIYLISLSDEEERQRGDWTKEDREDVQLHPATWDLTWKNYQLWYITVIDLSGWTVYYLYRRSRQLRPILSV